MKNKDKTEWYQLEVTAEQLIIIQQSVEAVSRAKIGQWKDIIELILEDFDVIDYDFVLELEQMINDKIQKRLQGKRGKRDNEMYQLYRDIHHYFANENGFDGKYYTVYHGDYVVSDKPRIKIEKIENEKSE